ncbi:MAG: hypothetical protein RR228_03860 [Bacilli bacterium]
MQGIEIIIVGVLVIWFCVANGFISTNKFVNDNSVLFLKLKEEDYDFLVRAKYGETAEPNKLFSKRIQNSFIVFILLILVFVTNFTYINLILAFAVSFFIFKSGYSSLQAYYRKHLHEIDMLLPYYLKSLEILIQHYTVPVAITKSLEDSPAIFKSGLVELIDSIDSGDSSIDPYMNFAKKYPVRDSMRMMRLLYRLGLGDQGRKQEQLIMFSKTISSLQAKSREMKYKDRLSKMEKKTMFMLSSTGIGVMVLLLLAVMQMLNF